AVDVMAHRLVLSFDAIADNVSASDVSERVVARVPPPTPVWNEEQRQTAQHNYPNDLGQYPAPTTPPAQF
ncbi:MoxR family ATPase, partial [Shigella sonnei]|nr:MoxR family ATPase [Shigella sonnei]